MIDACGFWDSGTRTVQNRFEESQVRVEVSSHLCIKRPEGILKAEGSAEGVVPSPFV